MVVDTVMQIGNRRVVAAKVASRPRPTLSNLSGDAVRNHERIVEYRNRVNALSADLDSATQALSAANAEIVRLRKEIVDLAHEYDTKMKELKSELKAANYRISEYQTKAVDCAEKKAARAKIVKKTAKAKATEEVGSSSDS